MVAKILLIEDDKDIVELITYNLVKTGFRVVAVSNGQAGLEKARSESPDVIILDIMLPDLDGLEVCKALKRDTKLLNIPLIFLTAKGEEIDRVVGLEVGADDYITKPFSPRELIARVRALLRRVQGKAQLSVIKRGGLTIDSERHIVTMEDRDIELSAMEYKLLNFLAANAGKVFSRTQLLDRVWGGDRFVTDRTVDVHVRRLREKIEKDPEDPKCIMTVRGFGYKFVCEP